MLRVGGESTCDMVVCGFGSEDVPDCTGRDGGGKIGGGDCMFDSGVADFDCAGAVLIAMVFGFAEGIRTVHDIRGTSASIIESAVSLLATLRASHRSAVTSIRNLMDCEVTASILSILTFADATPATSAMARQNVACVSSEKLLAETENPTTILTGTSSCIAGKGGGG